MDLGEPGRGAAVYEQHLFYCKEKIKLAALKKKAASVKKKKNYRI